MEYKIDSTPLEKSLKRLKDAFQEFQKDLTNDYVRDSVIQRYEFTYELAVSFIERYVKMNNPSENSLTFNELIRRADEFGILLGNLEKWILYRHKRNVTSHTYDEQKAQDVISIVPEFIKEVEFLSGKLNEKNKS